MSNNINEVRERLEKDVEGPLTTYTAVCARSDLRALLDDHAHLQGKNAELAGAVRGLLDALPSATTHPAIAAARKAVQE